MLAALRVEIEFGGPLTEDEQPTVAGVKLFYARFLARQHALEGERLRARHSASIAASIAIVDGAAREVEAALRDAWLGHVMPHAIERL